MTEKENGFVDIIKEGFSFITQMIAASVFPHIQEGADIVLQNIDDRIALIERRALRKVSTMVIIGFGGAFLALAILFFLIDYLHASPALAFFSIGITVFVIGLILKAGGYDT